MLKYLLASAGTLSLIVRAVKSFQPSTHQFSLGQIPYLNFTIFFGENIVKNTYYKSENSAQTLLHNAFKNVAEALITGNSLMNMRDSKSPWKKDK